jgi:predicted DNA-binding protein
VDKKMLSIRATEEEHKILARYARQQGRTMSDVLRELIRGLAAQPTKKRA